MARLAFALAATCASTSALVAPTAAKASTSLNVATTSYDPSDFSDVKNLPGILAPVEFFDPLNFAADASESELKRYREAELTHGRVAMLASVGFLVGESGATPLFGGRVDGIAINQFWKVPEGFWPVILLFIAVPETFRALRGWMEPTVPENYFQLRPGYTPGDLVPRRAETYLLCGVCVCVVVVSSTSPCEHVSHRWRGSRVVCVCCDVVDGIAHCLFVAARRERTRPATHPGGFARRTSIPSASSPRTPRRSRRCRPRSSSTAASPCSRPPA